MRFGSLCSGIEAASQAWNPLGWQCAFVSEIDKFPGAVLKHHYPDVPNLGDITDPDFCDHARKCGPIDLLCAGTPCQSFSVAGNREGLKDSRGNLTLRFVEIVNELRPRWIVWENVPGVLSDETNAFGCLLAGLAGHDAPLEPPIYEQRWRNAGIVSGPKYGLARRVLNAQFFGVPQRRERVFLVGHLGTWTIPARAIFESQGLPRDSQALRKEETADHGTVANCLTGRSGSGRNDQTSETYIINCRQDPQVTKQAQALETTSHSQAVFLIGDKVSHALKAEGADGSEDGTGRRTSIIFTQNQSGDVLISDKSCTLNTNQNASGRNCAKILDRWTVRRITVVEAERLQGFPDNWTRIPWRGKPASECPDGPRYKAIGNSWAVPVAAWIGKRIQELD